MKLKTTFLMGIAAVAVVLTGCSKPAQDSAKSDDPPKESGTSEPSTSQTEQSGEPASSGGVLKFTAIPDQNKVALAAKFGPVAKYLEDTLKVKCEYVSSTDYDASVRMFENGDVHIAWFGGLTGVQAMHNVKGARAIAQGKEDPYFMSYFIAHPSAGLEPSETFPEAMAGKSFTFGSNKSTSGRLMPEHFLRQNTGKSPEEFFGSKPNFSGAHDATIELVASGQAQVGAVNFKTYDKWAAKGGDTNNCKIIWKTPTYADYNFTAHPDLETLFGAGFIDKLQTALIEMDDSLAQSAFDRETLIAAKNEDFATIEAVARDLEFIR